jgi:hypothetical protein
MTDEFEQAAIAYYRQQRASHSSLHDALVIAEGQRDQAKLRAEKAEAERDALRTELAKYPTLDGALVVPCKMLEVQPNDKPTWKHIEPRDAFETEWTILP